MATTESGIYYQDDYNVPADILTDMKKMAESTDKVIKENKYNDTPIKTDLQAIKQEQQDQNSKIENNTVENKDNTELLKQIMGLLPSAKGEGEHVTLQDTGEARFKNFQVQGNSKQETRSGKNKFDINLFTNNTLITDKDSDTGSFKLSNAWASLVMNNTNVVKIFKANTKYKIIVDITLLSKPSNLSQTIYIGSLLALQKAGVPSISILGIDRAIKENWQVDETKHIETIFTTPNDLSEFGLIGYCYYTDNNKAEGSFKFENVMLLEVTEQDETFEPYGASPSLEFPSKIRNVGDNINWFNKDGNVITSIDTEKTPIETGVKVTVKAKGTAKYCVMKLGGSELLGKTFILHGEARFSGKNNGLIGLYFGTESNFNIQWITDTNYLTIESSKFKRVFTVPDTFPEGSDTIYILLYANARSTETKVGDYVEYRDLKIKEDSQVTAYSPYGCGNTEVIVCNKNVANLNIVDTQFRAKTEKINNNTFKVTNTSVEATAYGQVEMYLQKNKQYTIFMQAEGKDIENAKISIMKDYNGKGYIKADITNYFTFTTEQEKLVILMYPTNKGNLQGLETIFKIMIVEGNNTQQEFNDNEQQSILFPLTEGQRLYKGDYLAEDGIHHVRNQIVLDGTEGWQLGGSGNNLINQRFYLANNDIKPNGAILCNYFKEMYRGNIQITVEDIEACNISNGRYIQIKINKKIASTVDEFKNWIKQKKNEGNPITLECEVESEIIEPYTQEQQEAYNKLKKLYSYNEQTNIFSKDEISPIFNVEAIKNLNATFAQLSATMLERS